MRVIGLFTGWACKQWINLAIANHLKIVTELHVMIAAHNEIFEKLDDGSLELAKAKWKDDDRVIFHTPEAESIKGCCDRTKCILLNQMRNAAKPEIGDIVNICDSDEFFNDAAVKEIKEKWNGPKWDMLEFDALYFAINMQWYMKQPGLGRMFRVRKREGLPDFHFKPTQRPIPQPQERQPLLEKNPLFHYSLLSKIKYKVIHWETERGMKSEKIKWLMETYAKWDATDHSKCNTLAAANPCGGNRFYVNDDMGAPGSAPFLYEYKGEHPKEIENSGLTSIKDFR